MVILSVGEYALDVPVQGLKHPNPRVHQWSMPLGCHDQHMDGCLLLLVLLLRLWSFMM
jgi:hypothetical protein